jgi:hypothetical protein
VYNIPLNIHDKVIALKGMCTFTSPLNVYGDVCMAGEILIYYFSPIVHIFLCTSNGDVYGGTYY